MARHCRTLVIGRVVPNSMIAAFAPKLTAMASKVTFKVNPLHLSRKVEGFADDLMAFGESLGLFSIEV